MESSFSALGFGLLFAVLLVYLLIVVNFQSWLDPFIILMALPGALSGIAWMLFLSRTTFSVPAQMGTIMCRRRGHGQQHPHRELREPAAQTRLRAPFGPRSQRKA